MSTALQGLPDLDADAGSGIVARRAVIRWGWRLFRREWRQQLLVLGLLTVAVAATIWGASVVTNAQIPPGYPTFGTGAAQVTLPGTDPQLAADIAAIAGRWGPADLIEKQNITTGTRQSVQLRAESPHGHYNSPLLGLVSGTYPAGPGQVALTSQVAARYGAHAGGTWHAAGTTWRVTGIVQDPSNLADQFALVAPGQIRHPSQVIMLLGPAAAQQLLSDHDGARCPGGNCVASHAAGERGLAGGAHPGGGGTRPGVHRPGVGSQFLRDGPAPAPCPRHARRDRRDRTQPPPGHDRGRPGRRRGRRAGRGGARPRRLDRIRADGAAGHRPRGGRGEPAVVGVRHRDRARDRDVGAGIPPSGQDDGRGPGGDRAVRPPRAAQGGAPVRPARRHRVRGRPRVPGVRRRPEWGGRRQRRAGARAVPAGRPGHHHHRGLPARPAGHQRAGRRGGPAAAGRDPDRAARPGPLPRPVRCRAGGDHVRRVPGHGDLHRRQHQVRQSAQLDRPGPVQQPGDRRRGPEPGPRPDGAVQRRPARHPDHASEYSRRQPARVRGATGNLGQPVPGGHAGTQCAELHRPGGRRFRLRGHPAVARHVRDQGQPDRSRHRHPHHAARAGRRAAPGDDLHSAADLQR